MQSSDIPGFFFVLVRHIPQQSWLYIFVVQNEFLLAAAREFVNKNLYLLKNLVVVAISLRYKYNRLIGEVTNVLNNRNLLRGVVLRKCLLEQHLHLITSVSSVNADLT